MPWLIKAEPYDPAIEATRTLYFSDIGFTTEPDDTPANTYWQRRISAPISSRRALWSGGDVGGYSEEELGQASLANDDGALNALWDYDWGGRLVQISYTAKEDPVFDDFIMVFNGTAEDFVPGDEAVIELRDLQVLLDALFSRGTFAGTGGLEGTAEMAGRNKPFCGGRCYQLEPVLIDSEDDIYMIDPLGYHALLAAKDRGDPHTVPGSDYADLATLKAADLSSVDYATCKALGLYRNSGKPAGRLTLTVEGVAPGGVWISTIADIIEHIVTTMTPFTTSDLNAAAFAAMNAAQPAVVQLWWDGTGAPTVRQKIDELCDTALFWWGFDDSRKLEIARYEGPAEVADYEFDERDIFELEPQLSERRMKSLRLGYRRYWTVLDGTAVVSSISDAEREAIGSEYRWTDTATHAGAAAGALLASEAEAKTLFTEKTDADDERDRRLPIFGPKSKPFRVEVPLTDGLQAGKTVKLTDSSYGLSAGRNFLVVEAEKDADEEVHRLAVVG